MRKTEADTTRSPLKCPRTHGARMTREPAVGSLLSVPGGFILLPRLLPHCGQGSARVRKQSPPPPRAPGAPGRSRHARGPPAPPPPAHSPNSCGRSLGSGGGAARRSLQGHRRQGGRKMGDALTALLGPFPTRPPTTKNVGSKA